MSDNLRTRIAAVQLAHMPDEYDRATGECPCGFKFQKWSELASHVADAVIRELGWREELAPADILHDGYVDPDTQWTYDRHEDAQKRAAIFNQAVAHRYVTDWETNDE